jgi:hypothetical protein
VTTDSAKWTVRNLRELSASLTCGQQAPSETIVGNSSSHADGVGNLPKDPWTTAMQHVRKRMTLEDLSSLPLPTAKADFLDWVYKLIEEHARSVQMRKVARIAQILEIVQVV